MQKCPFCEQKLKNIYGLKRHITKAHKNGYCPICNKKVKFLETHIFQEVFRAKEKKHQEVYHLFFNNWKMRRFEEKIEAIKKC